MKIQLSKFVVLIGMAVGQFTCFIGNAAEKERLVFSLVSLESQTNLVVLADDGHPQDCGAELTNVLSNTNLFTASEHAQLEIIKLKYQNVTTNYGPAGTILKGMALRQQRWRQLTNSFRVACFLRTNSNDLEEVSSPYDIDSYFLAKYRTPQRDGYNILFNKGKLLAYQEFKAGILDGVWCQMYDDGKISRWVRFERGKVIGQYLSWDTWGEIRGRTVFKEPYDLIKNAVGNISMDSGRQASRARR